MDVQEPASLSPRQLVTPAIVAVPPFLLKPQRMNGLSERLLVSHYENNYGGAVRRLNAIREARGRRHKLGPPSHDAAEIALLFLMMNARVTASTMTYLVELGGVVRN